jgi:ketosteroid isomerase-like protein
MFKYLAIFVVSLAMLSGCAQPPADTSADLAALKAEVLDWMAAYNAGDADGVAAMNAEDAVVMAPGAVSAVGRAAIRDFIAADIANTKAAGFVFTGDESSDGGIDGNTGWTSGTFAVEDSAGGTVATGKYLTVYEKRNGDWQIIRDMWNLDPSADVGQQLAEAYIGIWNSQELDGVDELISADFKRRAPDQNAEGRAEIKAFMANVHDTYANFKIDLEATANAGDIVFVHWTSISNGLKSNESADAIEVPGISMLRHANGKITEEHVFYDTATLNAAMGTDAIPHAK